MGRRTQIGYIVVELLAIFIVAQGALMFQPTSEFAALQLKLTTNTGFISQNSGNTFQFTTNGYTNLSSLGLSLCGYDIPPTQVLQFRAQASFSEQTNTIIIVLLPTNGVYPNFELSNPTVYNRFYQYNVTGPFYLNSTSNIIGVPYIRSIYSLANTVYNYQNITELKFASAGNIVLITVFLNYSMVAETCLSILYFYQSEAMKNNFYINISFAMGLRLNSIESDRTLATVSQNNFGINSIYGPNFSPKCIVGIQSFKMSSGSRQTLSFNTSGTGVYGLISSSIYQLNYNWLCIAQIICPLPTQQYYPFINECQPICVISNCGVCSTSTSCQSCLSGFFINNLYRCTACLSNCEICASLATCTKCLNGYFFNATAVSCVKCPLYCLNCTYGYCQNCQTGYIPSGNQCIKCSTLMPRCITCTSSMYCSVCPQNTFFQSTSTGCVFCNISNVGCLTCLNIYTCYTCQPAYYLYIGTCKACTISVSSCCPYFVANCVTCANVNTCTICKQGFFLSNGRCTNCSLGIANCINCVNSTVCSLCQDNYFLQANKSCGSCSSISYCLICSNASYCHSCVSPYLAVNGLCLDCPIWPMSQLYYLQLNNVCHSCALVTASCVRCASKVLCTFCQDLYFLSNNSCHFCGSYIDHCYSCKDTSACSICQNGYYVDVNNPLSCLTCNKSIAHCLACSNVYYNVINSYVLTCSICAPEYYINDTICSACSETILFCLTCINNYQCTLCQDRYYLSSILTCISCEQIISGCTSCNSSMICLNCQSGYYLINSYCTLCSMAINYCSICSYLNTTLTCQNCLTGYYLAINFTCQICNSTLQFCTNCLNQSFCLSCISGYVQTYLGGCSPCGSLLPYCAYCTSDLRCLKCVANYILDQYQDCLSCGEYISGCLSCGYVINNYTNLSQLNCSSCSSAYLIYRLQSQNNFTKCIACNLSIFYCLQCSDLAHCKICNNMSFLNNESKCSLCSLYLQHCLYCTNSSLCLGCMGSYYLASNGTCVYCNASQFGTYSFFFSMCLQCVIVNSLPVCNLCSQGYYLKNNSCSPCSTAISLCKVCTSSNLCVTCQDGYYVSVGNNQCLPCDSSLVYCSYCLANGTCLACQSDCYLNVTLNRCFKCSDTTSNCVECNSSAVCSKCGDGYYFSGEVCASCAETMDNCVLCDSSSKCLLVGTSSSTSSIIFIVILVLCVIVIIIILVWVIRKYRQERKNYVPKAEVVSYQSQRQLLTENDMNSQGASEKTVKLTNRQKCQNCNQNLFDVMNIQLLCHHCAENKERGREHFIQHAVDREKKKNHQKNQREMAESIPSSDDKLEPPPPSTLQPHPQVMSDVRHEKGAYQIKEQGQEERKKNVGSKKSPVGHEQLIRVPEQTQSCVEQGAQQKERHSRKGISLTAFKQKPAE